MTRPEFRTQRNEDFYKIKKDTGMSYTQIAMNKNYNPEGLTPQRIHMIVKDWEKRLKLQSFKEERSNEND